MMAVGGKRGAGTACREIVRLCYKESKVNQNTSLLDTCSLAKCGCALTKALYSHQVILSSGVAVYNQ